jgi:hypothetical protein
MTQGAKTWSEWYRIALARGHDKAAAVHYANLHYIDESAKRPRAA